MCADLEDDATHYSATAKLLYAARPLTWRGQGELPQLPWPQPHKGLVLVIDMWSGIGGLLVALLALGIRCVAISAEQDEEILPSVKQHFPNVVHVPSVEQLRGEDFVPVLRRRAFTAIVLGGGSPCQGNSALNLRRNGWQDPRSQQPRHLQRLHTELRQHMAVLGINIPVFTFLENVGSTPPDVISRYTEMRRAAGGY